MYWKTLEEKKKNEINRGVALHFEEGINDNAKGYILKLVRFIRGRHYFPIRLDIYCVNKESIDGYYYYFETSKRNKRVAIYVALKESDNNLLIEKPYHLCKAITLYYYWLKKKKVINENEEIREYGNMYTHNFYDYEFGVSLLNDNLSKEELLKYIINHYVFSIETKECLFENLNTLSMLQWGTIVSDCASGGKLSLFKALKRLCKSKYEKGLFNTAINEIAELGYMDKATVNFYMNNNPREDKPDYPFSEVINYPIVLKQFDVAECYDGVKFENLVIGIAPKEDDYYLAYTLNKKVTNKEELVDIHLHPRAMMLNKIDISSLSDEEKENYYSIVKVFKGNNL